MTDTARNLAFVIAGGVIPIVGLMLYLEWSRWRRRLQPQDLADDTSDFRRWFPAPLPPRNFTEYAIPMTGHCTPTEDARFTALVGGLSRDTIEISEAEDYVHQYVSTCRVERRLIDRDMLRIVGNAIVAAKARRHEDSDHRFFEVLESRNSTQEPVNEPTRKRLLILEETNESNSTESCSRKGQ